MESSLPTSQTARGRSSKGEGDAKSANAKARAAKAKQTENPSSPTVADVHIATLAARIAELEDRLVQSELDNNGRALRARIERLERDVVTYREAREAVDLAVTDLRSALDQSATSIEMLKASPAHRLGSLFIDAGKDLRQMVRLPRALVQWSRENREQREQAEGLLVSTGSVTEYAAAAERALEIAKKRGLADAKLWVANQQLRDSVAARALSDLAMFARDNDPHEAVRLAEAALEADPNESRVKRLAFLMAEAGSVTHAAQILRSAIGGGAKFNASEEGRCQELLAMADLAATGLSLAPKRRWVPPIGSEKRCVLIFAPQAFPYHWSSVSVRTHAVASTLARAGVLVSVVTAPGYPDVGNRERIERPFLRNIDGVDYHLLPYVDEKPNISDRYVKQASLSLISFMRRMKTTALIAPLDLMHGYPAMLAAQAFGVPLMFDCWSVSPSQDECRTERGRILSRAEDTLLQYASAALARTPAIAARLEQVPKAPKVYLAVDYAPATAPTEVADRAKGDGAFVFGYVGDNNADINVDSLAELLRILLESGLDARLVIHSVGTRIQALRDQLEFAGLGHRTSIVTKSPPGRHIGAAYQELDVVVIPFGLEDEAIKAPFQVVTALRQGKCAVAVGDVRHRDLFGSAVVWADDIRSAAESLMAFALDAELVRAQEAKARAWDADQPGAAALQRAVESV